MRRYWLAFLALAVGLFAPACSAGDVDVEDPLPWHVDEVFGTSEYGAEIRVVSSELSPILGSDGYRLVSGIVLADPWSTGLSGLPAPTVRELEIEADDRFVFEPDAVYTVYFRDTELISGNVWLAVLAFDAEGRVVAPHPGLTDVAVAAVAGPDATGDDLLDSAKVLTAEAAARTRARTTSPLSRNLAIAQEAVDQVDE